ncbi:DUF4395 domain-containing protein [Candidatus Nomurabacteria bacterium]|nr:DUF4395 domain-containing protein [Candidatus Nomurabacteria bacterium]
MSLKEKYFTFGKVIPGLTIDGQDAPYPVMNDREVRAIAGIMFVFGIVAFSFAFFQQNFLPLKVVVVLFFLDFSWRVFFGITLSPIAILARILIRGQKPEWVGAVQKRFAWSIGVALSSLMILLLFIFDVRGPINLTVCLICLTFMWLETSFGICVGCKIYYGLIRASILKEPDYRPACPGGVCTINKPKN